MASKLSKVAGRHRAPGGGGRPTGCCRLTSRRPRHWPRCRGRRWRVADQRAPGIRQEESVDRIQQLPINQPPSPPLAPVPGAPLARCRSTGARYSPGSPVPTVGVSPVRASASENRGLPRSPTSRTSPRTFYGRRGGESSPDRGCVPRSGQCQRKSRPPPQPHVEDVAANFGGATSGQRRIRLGTKV